MTMSNEPRIHDNFTFELNYGERKRNFSMMFYCFKMHVYVFYKWM